MRTRLLLLPAVLSLLASLRAAELPATFGLTNIWTIEVRLSPTGWNNLTSSRTFTQADLTINGHAYTNVAVRQKGGGGTASGWAVRLRILAMARGAPMRSALFSLAGEAQQRRLDNS